MQEPLLGWAEAALGRAQGRVKPREARPDPFPVFGSLCTQIWVREGTDERPRGRGSTWETSVSPVLDNSTRQGHAQVIVCVLPTLSVTAWLREEVLGTDLNEFRKFPELIEENIRFPSCFSSACRALPRPSRRVPGLSSAPSAFPRCCSRLALAGSAPGFAPGSGFPPCELGVQARLGGSCSGSSAVPLPGFRGQTSPVPPGLLHDKVDVLVLPTCRTCPYDGVPYSWFTNTVYLLSCWTLLFAVLWGVFGAFGVAGGSQAVLPPVLPSCPRRARRCSAAVASLCSGHGRTEGLRDSRGAGGCSRCPH